MASEDIQTNLRLPAELKDRLQASAERSERSLSAQVAYLLGRAFELEPEVARLAATVENLHVVHSRTATELMERQEELAALKARLAAADTAVTKDQLDAMFERMKADHDEALLSVILIRDMLGNHVQRLYERLSEEDKANDVYQFMKQLADSVVKSDTEELTRALRKVVNERGFDNPEEAARSFAEANKRSSREKWVIARTARSGAAEKPPRKSKS